MKKTTMWFSNRSDKNWSLPSQKMAKTLEILDLGSGGILSYPCSENKGADQLRVHREADPRRRVRICRFFFS